MPIDLYYMDESPPCLTVIMAAKMVKVDVNMKYVDLNTEDHMKPEFIAINPQHNIPTIVDDDLRLNESRAICAYLVNQYAKDDTLYPKEPKVRALVDQRLYFDMGVFYLRFSQIYYPIVLDGATQLDKKAQKEFAEAVDFLENFLTQRKYAADDHLTIADISLMASASTMQATDKTVFEKHPHIQNWMERCKAEIPNFHEITAKGNQEFREWVEAGFKKIGLSLP